MGMRRFSYPLDIQNVSKFFSHPIFYGSAHLPKLVVGNYCWQPKKPINIRTKTFFGVFQKKSAREERRDLNREQIKIQITLNII
jgi:hypothetical protein